MSNGVLYYPYIEFQKKDYQWLWRSALLWDRVYRIVPREYKPNDPDEIKELCSTGEIGKSIAPDRYRKSATQNFMKNYIDIFRQNKANNGNHQNLCQDQNYTKVFISKIDEPLKSLIANDVNLRKDETGAYLPRNIANHFMVYLATEIAKTNHLSMNTDDVGKWAASSVFLRSNRIQESLITSKDYINIKRPILAPLLVNQIFPANITKIPPSKILKFRSERAGERQQFIMAYDHFRTKLSQAEDPDVLEQIWNDEQNVIKKAIHDYKSSMDILGVIKWSGYIVDLLMISLPAASTMLPYIIQPLTPIGIGLGCIGFTLKILEKKTKVPHSPYSYLGQVHTIYPKDFERLNTKLHHNFLKIKEDSL